MVRNPAMADLSNWHVTELSLQDNCEQANSTLDANGVSKRFFDWQFEGAFDYAIVTTDDLPSICLGIDLAHARLQQLQKLSVRGFALLVATNATREACLTFFNGLGYSVSNEVSGRDQLVQTLCGPWDERALRIGLTLAARMGCKIACGFGHDADPLYLFAQETPMT
jgi:hypothetical protein